MPSIVVIRNRDQHPVLVAEARGDFSAVDAEDLARWHGSARAGEEKQLEAGRAAVLSDWFPESHSWTSDSPAPGRSSGSRAAFVVAKRRPKTWYRTIDRVDPRLLSQHKLLFPDIKASIHPVLDKGQTYPHHNLYFVTSQCWDLEVLGGLLLPRVAQLFVEAYAVRMRGGYLRFQAQYLRRIRVP